MAFAAAAMLSGPMVATPADTLAATQNVDGLVNVVVGDVTIEDVNVAAVVPVIVLANLCDISVINVERVAVLAAFVDQHGGKKTVCRNEAGQKVVITQN